MPAACSSAKPSAMALAMRSFSARDKGWRMSDPFGCSSWDSDPPPSYRITIPTPVLNGYNEFWGNTMNDGQ